MKEAQNLKVNSTQSEDFKTKLLSLSESQIVKMSVIHYQHLEISNCTELSDRTSKLHFSDCQKHNL